MSRDTAGQPVTASGPGKSSASGTGAMPPVPGPDAPSTDAAAPAAKAASPATSGKASAGAGTGSGAAAAGTAKVAAGKPAPGKSSGTATPAAGSAKVPAAQGSSTQTQTKVQSTKAASPASAPTTPEAAASAASASAGSRSGAGDPVSSVREPKARTTQEKASAPSLSQKTTTGPRRVRLAVSRLDPWSVMKLSFLLSIAIGIMIVVASVVFWMVLDGLHVFTEVNDMIVAILGEETEVSILQFVELKRVVSLSTMIAIVDVVLLTALSTIAAFLYNVVAALVGGVHLTLTDE
ncbi:DUF3566 domain-containing protein [Sanguibacter suarezii]|uniref:DUF3566 domain-containing protein n=1 Tax=Sanguibacter suarezii TaxID=60921 RepID=UPI000AB1E974|nr:DUF3566 domain-containing protein [Sanguibacter suarezii]